MPSERYKRDASPSGTSLSSLTSISMRETLFRKQKYHRIDVFRSSFDTVMRVRGVPSNESSRRGVFVIETASHQDRDMLTESLLREAEIQKIVHSHRNIVSVLDTGGKNTGLRSWMLLEDCSHGRMDYYFSRNDRSDALIQDIAGQLKAGVEYMHSCTVAHLDLFMPNILLAPDPQSENKLILKIADFGKAIRSAGAQDKLEDLQSMIFNLICLASPSSRLGSTSASMSFLEEFEERTHEGRIRKIEPKTLTMQEDLSDALAKSWIVAAPDSKASRQTATREIRRVVNDVELSFINPARISDVTHGTDKKASGLRPLPWGQPRGLPTNYHPPSRNASAASSIHSLPQTYQPPTTNIPRSTNAPSQRRRRRKRCLCC